MEEIFTESVDDFISFLNSKENKVDMNSLSLPKKENSEVPEREH